MQTDYDKLTQSRADAWLYLLGYTEIMRAQMLRRELMVEDYEKTLVDVLEYVQWLADERNEHPPRD